MSIGPAAATNGLPPREMNSSTAAVGVPGAGATAGMTPNAGVGAFCRAGPRPPGCGRSSVLLRGTWPSLSLPLLKGSASPHRPHRKGEVRQSLADEQPERARSLHVLPQRTGAVDLEVHVAGEEGNAWRDLLGRQRRLRGQDEHRPIDQRGVVDAREIHIGLLQFHRDRYHVTDELVVEVPAQRGDGGLERGAQVLMLVRGEFDRAATLLAKAGEVARDHDEPAV